MNSTTTDTYVGWKQIADYLSVAVATAKRWAKEKAALERWVKDGTYTRNKTMGMMEDALAALRAVGKE